MVAAPVRGGASVSEFLGEERRTATMQPISVPSAWIVAATAAAVGTGMGAGVAIVRSQATPGQLGGFRLGTADAGMRSGPTGSIAVAETVHDFGVVGVGGSGAHDFVVTNVGAGPLRLTRGATSCTCTIADFEHDDPASPDAADRATKVVPPGDSTRVTLQWKGRGPGGRFRQQATILTDDPRRPEIVFVVEGTAVPTWKAVPETLLLSRVSPTAGDTATVRVFTFGDAAPRVEHARIDHPQADACFTVTTSPLDPAEVEAEPAASGGVLVTVAIRPGLPLGAFNAVLLLTVAIPEELTIEVPVAGSVTGDLSVVAPTWDRNRQALMLGTVSGRQGLRTRAFLMARGPDRDAVRPTVREVVPATLEVTVGAGVAVGTGGVRRIPLEITVPPGSRPVNHLCSEVGPAGRIVLDTGHPHSPTLTIPVCIAIGP